MGLQFNQSFWNKAYKIKIVVIATNVCFAVVLGIGLLTILSSHNHAAADYLGFTPSFFIGDKLTPSGITGLARDSAGNTYIGDSRGHIKKVGPSGNLITEIGRRGDTAGTYWTGLRGIAVDSANTLYAVDTERHVVNKYSTDGTYLSSLGTFDVSGTGDGQFNTPYWVAVDSSDNVYVTDRGNNRIQKFDNNGNFVWKSGTPGAGNGQFNGPKIIAVNNTGVVYISETGNNRVQEISAATGAYVGQFTYAELLMGIGCSVGGAGGMGFDQSNNLYMSTSGIGCSPIFVFNSADIHTNSFTKGNFSYALTVTSNQHLLFSKSTLTIPGTQSTSEVYETDLAGGANKQIRRWPWQWKAARTRHDC